MGFFNSLKGQVGRDTGRVISNTIFGNKHASKYQRVDAQNTRANLKAQRDYELEILEQEQQNSENEFERLQLRENNLRLEKEIANIISVKVPQKKEDLMEALDELYMMISANPWKDIIDKENTLSNKYSDVVLKKYEQCLFSLKSKFPKEREIIYYENQIKKLKNEKIKGKILSPTFIFLILMVAFIVWGISSGYFERSDKETNQRREKLMDKIFK
ncbi:hypothetical protein ABF190_002407 [Flavobacterium psychrophilum]|uniref:hypothetical protein n=1 Tax=Flavobacterium psychrophilum TaxID=96345 RepID=UPI000B7C2A07|nr:hypothetical protein [Flavobacterium psychrophilum]EKT3967432.1 hypothetical protein [Flavobacterium psychrophilum]SNB03370.1 conserved hypothetical protein [Flavobacterium psychrophilum]